MTWYPYDNRELVSGMFIKVEIDDKVETMLVGDVNQLGGVCDCCSIYREGKIIEYSISKLEYITELKNE